MQELKKLKVTTPKFVYEALFNLPKSLDETYERMLVAIDDPWRIHALKLLRWLAYAESPLSLSELVEAAAIDFTEEGVVEVYNRPELSDVLEILSGLVVIERNKKFSGRFLEDEVVMLATSSHGYDNTEVVNYHKLIDKNTKIRLAHFSVKEYLESERILANNAREFHLCSGMEHKILSHSCLNYLIHYSDSENRFSTWVDLTTFPFLRYAAKSWFYHSERQEFADGSCEIALLQTGKRLLDWLQVHQPDRPWLLPFQGTNEATIGSPLYYACFLRREILIDSLLSGPIDVNAEGGEYRNALLAASWKGSEGVVQRLIDAGADVNAEGGKYGNALLAASSNGHEGIVQRLIDGGADVNAQGGEYGSALIAASWNGHEGIVLRLIYGGADVNAQGEYYGSALQASSRWGHTGIVQRLIEAGANLNASGGWHSNALLAASVYGHEGIVQRLIDGGVDVNAEGGAYGSALIVASWNGHEGIVQRLINGGTNVNAQGRDEEYALQVASRHGHEGIVQILIDAGAEINARGGYYGTALEAAFSNGHEGIVQMLIDAGADINARGGYYGTELEAAFSNGDEGVVQRLVNAGVRR